MTEDHYFTPEPAAPSRPRRVRLRVGEKDLQLWTDTGVFSHGSVDLGTRVLLERAPKPPSEGHVLDLGCGYGPIAIWIASMSPDAKVWATDVNLRAVSLTARNAAENRLDNLTACIPGEVPSDVEFAAIYSNPPVHIGKSALHELLSRWLPRLVQGGEAFLVVQKHLGSDSLLKWMNESGFPTEKLASRKGYRILVHHRAGS